MGENTDQNDDQEDTTLAATEAVAGRSLLIPTLLMLAPTVIALEFKAPVLALARPAVLASVLPPAVLAVPYSTLLAAVLRSTVGAALFVLRRC